MTTATAEKAQGSQKRGAEPTTPERQAGWRVCLEEFYRQHRMRPTRLGVIKAGAVMEDLWLEDGLPLTGISLEIRGDGSPVVEIMLGGAGEAARSMTHTIARVRKVRLQLTDGGSDDGLEVEDVEGATTLLRFEPSPQG